MISPTNEFKIQSIHGCWLVSGRLSPDDCARLTAGFSKNAVMDLDSARTLNALMVIGEPDDIERLRKALKSPQEQGAGVPASRVAPTDAVTGWLADGERGLSSEALCKAIYGVPANAGVDHPRDVGDMLRCLKFLSETSSSAKIELARSLSPVWDRLIDRWQEIETAIGLAVQEAGHAGFYKTSHAQLAQSLMDAAISGAENKAQKFHRPRAH